MLQRDDTAGWSSSGKGCPLTQLSRYHCHVSQHYVDNFGLTLPLGDTGITSCRDV